MNYWYGFYPVLVLSLALGIALVVQHIKDDPDGDAGFWDTFGLMIIVVIGSAVAALLWPFAVGFAVVAGASGIIYHFSKEK